MLGRAMSTTGSPARDAVSPTAAPISPFPSPLPHAEFPDTTCADEVHAMDRAKELDLATQIKDIMISVLELDIDREHLDEKVSLYSPTVGLDSLSLLHILVAIEKHFDIEIDD